MQPPNKRDRQAAARLAGGLGGLTLMSATAILGFLLLGGLTAGCSSTKTTTMKTVATNPQVLENADPFAVLDEQQQTGSIDPQLIEQRLDAARQQWLRALAAQEKNNRADVVKHFELSIDILNRLINYPTIENNKEFQDLTRDVMADYEKYVTKIDALPPNASIFALRQKFEEDMAKMDIRKVPMPPADLSKTTIPMTINTAVEQTIAYFTQGNGRPFMSKWLARTGKYFPMMKQVMREEGVPEEIDHLSMIESGLNPTAVSWAKAVGMWQFIDATGSRYGLTNNWWLDKRRDPVTATRAAAHHLHDLYNALGDWQLALAAYNSGINRVRAAMQEAGPGATDFWSIRPFLPKETQNYVPLFIAASLIEMNPAHYGFNNIQYEKPMAFDTVHVKEAVDINALAKAAGVSGLEIKELNPELLQPSTPPLEICGPNGYCLKVPPGTDPALFYQRLGEIPSSEKMPWLMHTVMRGESMASIARTYGISSAQLADYNDLSEGQRLRHGQRLRVPMTVMGPSNGSDNIASSGAPAQTTTKVVIHKVRRGETLHAIASHFGVSIGELKSWNHLGRRGIRKGQSLKIHETVRVNLAAARPVKTKEKTFTAPAKDEVAANADPSQSDDETPAPVVKKAAKKSHSRWVSYKVRRGDTMAKIADNFGVSLASLKKWNKSAKHRVKVGQSLKVYASAEYANASEDESGSASFHTVRQGETLTSIGKLYGTTAAQVASWNGDMDPSELRAGAKIKVFASNQTPSKGDGSVPTKRHRKLTYRVKSGDTLYDIADKFGVTVAALKSANRMHTSIIAKGKRLVIPND